MQLPTSLTHVAILWSMIAAGSLLLGFVHVARWLLDRRALADLAFSLVAFSFVGVALIEVGCMHARDAAEWGEWVRWGHLPLFGLVVGTATFIHLFLGTGRRWLLWTLVGMRSLILVINFTSHPNVTFAEIATVEKIRFLGALVTVGGETMPGRWQFLGLLSSLLLLVYVLDAAIAKWRAENPDERRGAILIGGSVFLMVLIALSYTQLTIYGFAKLPFVITPAFLPPLMAMSFELGYDMLRASRLARQLHDSRLRLELAAGSAHLGLWEWDGGRGRILATRQACQIFGVPEDQSGDFARWMQKIQPEDAERITGEITRALESGEEYSAEFRISPDGVATRWISAHGRAERSRPGGPALVRGILRDVSEQRRAQDETQELRRELAHAGRVSLLGQLSSSLAHEISQPLSAIQRNAEAAGMLLESGSPDHEELKAIVTDILRDDRRAREVIDRLRTMLKRRATESSPITPDGLLQDVLALVGADAASRGVRVEHRASPGMPTVAGDRVQLTQVLLNLVLNAVDAVAEMPAAQRLVVLSSRLSASGAVELCVTDRGPGIPAGDARKIFEPFFTTKSAGMGLGLAISRTIAEAHDGSLSGQNEPEGGATFCFSLPAKGGEAP